MPEFPLSHASVMDLIAWRHSIAGDKRTALRGRLQHFQRKRFPPGANTGRGKPAAYDWEQLILLAVAFDLVELGLPPDLAIEVVNGERDRMLDAMAAADDLKPLGIIPVSPTLMVLEMRALEPLKDEMALQNHGIHIITNEQFSKVILGSIITDVKLPVSVIDLRGVVEDLFTWISDIYGLGLAATYNSFTHIFYPGYTIFETVGGANGNP